MRITIGHVLMGTAAGFMVFRFIWDPSRIESLESAGKGFVAEAQSWVSFFKTSQANDNNVQNEPVVNEGPPQTQSVDLTGSNALKEVPKTEAALMGSVGSVAEPPVTSPSPVATLVVEKKNGEVKKLTARRRKAIGKTKTLAPKAAPIVDPLVGQYVSVELASGQKVQGVLEARNAAEIKIQLPGMGPFSYQAKSIKSIKLVE